MKKIYLLLTLMLLCIGQSFASKTVEITLRDEAKLAMMEFRDGGADGTLITPDVSAYYPSLTFENGLWIHCTNPDGKLFVSTYKGGVIEKEIVDQSCFYTMDELEGLDRITIQLSVPRYLKVMVEDPSIMKFTIDSSDADPLEATAGENRFALGEYDSFYISVADPNAYKLTRVYNETQAKECEVSKFSYSRISYSGYKDNDVFSYTLVPASEFDMPKVKIRVDEPNDASIKFGYDAVKDLVANEWNEVELPSYETEYSVSHTNWREEVYKVTLNGTPVKMGYSSYNGTLKDGDELDIQVYPEAIDYTVTVNVVPEDCAPFIHTVLVNDEEVDHQTGDFTVRNGKKIKLNFNTDYYDLKGITIDEKEVDLEGEYVGESYTYKVTGDATITVTVEKKPINTLILDIDNPDAVNVRQNYTPVEIKEGENEITYTSSNNRLQIKKLLGATYDYFAVVKDGVTSEIEDPEDEWELRMDDSYTKVIVRVTPLKVDKQFVVYFDTDEETMTKFNTGYSFGSFSFYSPNAGGSYSDKMKPGYTIFDFADVYLPYYWSFSVYSSEESAKFTKGVCYVDGEILEKEYTSWELNDLKDGSVVKCYITKEPRTFTADIAGDEDVEFNVIKDKIVKVDDLSSPLTDLEDTEIEIVPAEGKSLSIFISSPQNDLTRAGEEEGELLKANEEGKYIIVLDGDKKISVKKDSLASVGDVMGQNSGVDVFTTTGVRMLHDATKAQIDALPAGIYVVGGKKMVKK
ncbi:MAG: hypothetical protein K2H96_09290 [Muribaculaceae bacterium]|nr:hypothetical protein [Muribaculaceae bacterium]